jgi:hypothetical protein
LDRSNRSFVTWRVSAFPVCLSASEKMHSYLNKQIALPQDHGAWVFILSPLLIGAFGAGSFSEGMIPLCVAVMAAFLLRQPMTVIVKVGSKRRLRSDLPVAWFWALTYGLIASLALILLIFEGFDYVLFLAAPGIPVFACHLWLVSRRAERKQAGIETLGTGVLALAAPAAFWVGIGRVEPIGWWLWILTWLQSAASIVYTYLRLNQREWESSVTLNERFRLGWRANTYTAFNVWLSAIFSLGLGILPKWIFIPFLLQWLETLWGLAHPATGWKPTRIGIRQLVVSTLWTVLFILTWRL